MQKQFATLDKTIFNKTIPCKALLVKQELVGQFLKLKKSHLHPVMQVAKDKEHKYPQGYKCILLKSGIEDKEIDDLLQQTNSVSTSQQIIYEMIQTYDDLSMSEILKQLLPKDIIQIPSSYEIVGTIAHLNLRPVLYPYKYIIGQIILSKNKQLKTVCNKTESLTNEYRTPVLEIIAGQDSYETSLKENNVKFTLNYSLVYWNSRLQFERTRMLKLFKKGETICDMFCGIGPLAIQAALQNLNVMANDLNPNCYKYLLQNMHLNKINTNTLIPYNMDARAFLNAMIDLPSSNNKQYLFNNTPSKCVFQHIYMNLPGDAISFCDVFTGFLLKADPTIWNLTNLPLVHVYTFSLGDTCQEAKGLVQDRLTLAMPGYNQHDCQDFYEIRDISTNKKMYCLSFQISQQVAIMDLKEKKVKSQ